MGVIDKVQVGGTTYDVQDAKVAPLDERVNALHNLVNYGYNAILENAAVGAGNLKMTRVGTRYVLAANYSSSSTPMKVILQESPLGYTSSFPSDQTPLPLVNGHTYRLHLYRISGTATNTIRVRFYHASVNAIGTLSDYDAHQYCDILYDESTYTNGLYACIYISRASTGNTITNYVCDIMLEDLTAGGEISVSGATPEITAIDGMSYVCTGQSTEIPYVDSLSFTPSATGICSVRFVSGTTPTVLSAPDTVIWPDWFDHEHLEASRTYEISIADGKFGVVTSWT